jgi:hypothetical protein
MWAAKVAKMGYWWKLGNGQILGGCLSRKFQLGYTILGAV